jgi:hypothetical protein
MIPIEAQTVRRRLGLRAAQQSMSVDDACARGLQIASQVPHTLPNLGLSSSSISNINDLRANTCCLLSSE